MDFNALIRKRASVRKFSDRKVNVEEVIECVEAANLSPSPGNLALLTYIIVSDEEKIKRIANACQQDFIEDAPFLVIVCSNNKQAINAYEERGDKYLKQHAGAAIEHFLLKVTDLGLSSCWIGAFSDMTVKNLMNIPNEFEIEAILPVAYEGKISKTKQRQKPSLSARVFYNSWKNKFYKKAF